MAAPAKRSSKKTTAKGGKSSRALQDRSNKADHGDHSSKTAHRRKDKEEQGKKPPREKLQLASDEDEASETLLNLAKQKANKNANKTIHTSKRSTAKGKRSYREDDSDVSCGSESPVKSRKRTKINETKRSRRAAPKVSYTEADASDPDESEFEETKKAHGTRTKKPQTAKAKQQKPVESDTDDTADESQLDESVSPKKNNAKKASSAVTSFLQEGGGDWRTASAIDY